MSERTSAAAACAAAAKAKEPDALRDGARRYAATAGVVTRRINTSPYTDQDLGAILVSGQARRYAEGLRRRLYRLPWSASREVPLVSIPEDDLHPNDVALLFEIRLLERRWSELPTGVGKPMSWIRPTLRRQRNLMRALAARDARKTKSAINAFARAHAGDFSLLAYALYRVARDEGIAVKVPRKYDF